MIDETDIRKAMGRLEDTGYRGLRTPPRIMVKDAEKALLQGLSACLGKGNATWLPEYAEVADWLSDGKGKGLLCIGNNGRGKSLIAMHVLPPLFLLAGKVILNVYRAREMNGRIDEIIGKRFAVIDDIGTEDVAVSYGNRRLALPEIVDAAEDRGNLLVLTTNLAAAELRAKYGERTFDRLVKLTRAVYFKGKSLRR